MLTTTTTFILVAVRKTTHDAGEDFNEIRAYLTRHHVRYYRIKIDLQHDNIQFYYNHLATNLMCLRHKIQLG